jgi:hypothetical protein
VLVKFYRALTIIFWSNVSLFFFNFIVYQFITATENFRSQFCLHLQVWDTNLTSGPLYSQSLDSSQTICRLTVFKAHRLYTGTEQDNSVPCMSMIWSSGISCSQTCVNWFLRIFFTISVHESVLQELKFSQWWHSCLLGCDVVLYGRKLSTFQSNCLPPWFWSFLTYYITSQIK